MINCHFSGKDGHVKNQNQFNTSFEFCHSDVDLREENEKIPEIGNMRLGVSFLYFVENLYFTKSIRGTTNNFPQGNDSIHFTLEFYQLEITCKISTRTGRDIFEDLNNA